MRIRTAPLLLLGLVLGACSDSHPPRPTTVEQFSETIHVGMSLDDVSQIMGQPEQKFPYASSMDPGIWVYTVGGQKVEVVFDDRKIVGEVRGKPRVETGLKPPQ